MAKHGVCHALAIILIITTIIYSTIANDFHETALTKQKSTKKPYIDYGFPKYPDAFDLNTCFEKCSKKFDKNLVARCNEKCELLKECIDECDKIYTGDYALQNCYKGCKFRAGGRGVEIRNPWLRKEY
ncbi:hypothetical protein PIB30_005892 [Stylosanthes scabra]|uniref:Uncharacterized protein n=1 Tax=Stylosanthes scabra TaxID=79078 RepID=A0ABU6Q459_9FABA|nr:hypothetical protein [Stylosanthes scabra]